MCAIKLKLGPGLSIVRITKPRFPDLIAASYSLARPRSSLKKIKYMLKRTKIKIVRNKRGLKGHLRETLIT